MKNLWRVVQRGPWPYWVGAIILGILNILILYVRQRPWGITGNIENWSLWLGAQVGLGIQKHTFSELLISSGTLLNLGVILGAFWATLVASQARFKPIRDKKFFYSALLGGFLMGYGSRIAKGCNIGAFVNGIASGSLTAWIFGASIILGTWIGTKLLMRFLV